MAEQGPQKIPAGTWIIDVDEHGRQICRVVTADEWAHVVHYPNEAHRVGVPHHVRHEPGSKAPRNHNDSKTSSAPDAHQVPNQAVAPPRERADKANFYADHKY